MSNVASLREVRRRIRSVENTKKITRAMEMVAASKLRRFQDLLTSARPYTEKIDSLLKRFLDDVPPGYSHPYLKSPQRTEWVREPETGATGEAGLIIFTSDTGLCGTYNGDLEQAVREFLDEHSREKISLIFVGKHARGVFAHQKNRVAGIFSDLRVSRFEETLENLQKTIDTEYHSGRFQTVTALYTRMESLSRCHVSVEKILPLNSPAQGEGPHLPEKIGNLPSSSVDWIVEPDLKTVLDKLIPASFEAKLRLVVYHALLTEQIARMSAMRQATQNAKEMIDSLTLARNKARQAAITKEIIEVVSGASAT